MDDCYQPVILPTEQQSIRARCFHPSGTFVEFPLEEAATSNIPARFEKIASMYPDHIAVKTSDNEITYEALNGCANRLARAIIAQRGTGQEPVGLYVEDDISLIIAHLASLKAGKFVLRLNPSAASSTTNRMLEDCNVLLILTDAHNATAAYHSIRPRTKLIDMNDVAPNLSDDNLALPLAANHYAYINYTSGSTGGTKGVLKSHGFMLHNVSSFANACNISVHDREAVIGRNRVNHAFRALLTGSTQCLIENEASFVRVYEWLNKEAVTVVISTPTTFRNFAATLTERSHFPSIRLIRLGGESLHANDFELYKTHFSPNCFLVSSYSSQETGTISFYLADRGIKIKGNDVPVGYVVEGVMLSILDELGNKVKPEQPGEIVVTSNFLSSGYYRNGTLITEHLGSAGEFQQKQSVYHTGDLGQLSRDGCLVHLGRKDSRVKIRGFRVDIREVEARLTEHADVTVAVVTAKEDSSGDLRLIAYYVSRDQPGPTITALREFLGATLPPYMVPSVFVALPELPITPSGKVNRRALPEPTESRPNLATPYVEAKTPIERGLVAIWQEILSLDQIGIHDNFFELGGHSLAASKIISRVIQTFRLELPLKALFETPTVAQMAAIIVEYQNKRASDADIEQILREIETMTEQEARRHLTS